MSKAEKLDLMGVASVAITAAVLLAAWIVTTASLTVQQRAFAVPEESVTLTQDGRMKLTVAAQRPGTVALAASTASPVTPVTLTADGRMKLTVEAQRPAASFAAAQAAAGAAKPLSL